MRKLLFLTLLFFSFIPTPSCFTVTDEQGKPIGSPQVLVFEMRGIEGQIRNRVEVSTSEGEFCFVREPSRVYVISIEKAGYEPFFDLYNPDTKVYKLKKL